MATFQKRGSKWRAIVTRDNQRPSKTFNTKAEAVFWANQMEAELDSGIAAVKDGHTLAEAMERYSEEVSVKKRGARWEQIRIKAYLRDIPFAKRKLEQIAPDDFARWRDARLKVVMGASVLRDMMLIWGILEVARKEWRWLRENPLRDVAKPRKSPHRTRTFSDEETRKVVECLGYFGGLPTTSQHQVAVALLLCLETALRSGEVYGLDWNRIFLRERFLRLDLTKNGDSREVPLSTKAVELLERFAHRTGPVFTIRSATADMLFRRARVRAGAENLHFHDSRATALTRLAGKLNVLELARMVGHRDPKSLMIYYRESASSLANKLG